jgi:hypothetical protein
MSSCIIDYFVYHCHTLLSRCLNVQSLSASAHPGFDCAYLLDLPDVNNWLPCLLTHLFDIRLELREPLLILKNQVVQLLIKIVGGCLL